jgi:hypothetical protein
MWQKSGIFSGAESRTGPFIRLRAADEHNLLILRSIMINT